eukprot:ctg_13.g6
MPEWARWCVSTRRGLPRARAGVNCARDLNAAPHHRDPVLSRRIGQFGHERWTGRARVSARTALATRSVQCRTVLSLHLNGTGTGEYRRGKGAMGSGDMGCGLEAVFALGEGGGAADTAGAAHGGAASLGRRAARRSARRLTGLRGGCVVAGGVGAARDGAGGLDNCRREGVAVGLCGRASALIRLGGGADGRSG